jgi:hypothetical protein
LAFGFAWHRIGAAIQLRPLLFDKLSQLWRRLLFYIYMRRDRFDRELEEEMRFHLEMKAEENLAAGISGVFASRRFLLDEISSAAYASCRIFFKNQNWITSRERGVNKKDYQ